MFSNLISLCSELSADLLLVSRACTLMFSIKSTFSLLSTLYRPSYSGTHSLFTQVTGALLSTCRTLSAPLPSVVTRAISLHRRTWSLPCCICCLLSLPVAPLVFPLSFQASLSLIGRLCCSSSFSNTPLVFQTLTQVLFRCLQCWSLRSPH